ncbi:DUF4133 domain-containing protein [Pedobacter sp. WC2423]|uniref:DUF4133 domain-containing protein n=1 Tax=Pedobacter sp. WC2423 TaxID=3234142 RepID=UPI003465A378
MTNSVYEINKGVNKSIEFKGLKAQYIWYFGAGAAALLIGFAIMYVIGINSYLCLGIIGVLGTMMTMKIYGLSNKYGEHGLMKKIARRSIPKVVKIYSRKTFRTLKPGKKENNSIQFKRREL